LVISGILKPFPKWFSFVQPDIEKAPVLSA